MNLWTNQDYYCSKQEILLTAMSMPLIQVLYIFFLSGCSSFTALTNYFNSTDHFLALSDDPRVMYEAGAENFAKEISDFLPQAIRDVQRTQNSEFQDEVIIYACISQESFKKITGRNVSAMAYRGNIFLSPEITKNKRGLELYLYHELSHLLLYQNIGGYKYICIPSWFTEGLAAFVSGGGGAEKVTDDEVREAIKKGNHFLPIAKAGLKDLFIPKYASYWGIQHQYKHHMFYRQSMSFVLFLYKNNTLQFNNFLIDINNGKNFSDSFQLSFGTSTMTKWEEFKNHLEKSANRSFEGV